MVTLRAKLALVGDSIYSIFNISSVRSRRFGFKPNGARKKRLFEKVEQQQKALQGLSCLFSFI